jgi:hypothetical protein
MSDQWLSEHLSCTVLIWWVSLSNIIHHIKTWHFYVVHTNCSYCFQPKIPAHQGVNEALDADICVGFTKFHGLLQNVAALVNILWNFNVVLVYNLTYSSYEEMYYIWHVCVAELWSGLSRWNILVHFGHYPVGKYSSLFTGNLFALQKYANFVCQHNCLLLILQKWFQN